MNQVLNTLKEYMIEVENIYTLFSGGRLNIMQAPTSIRLELVTQGLTSPVFLTNAKDGSGRLFIVEQGGLIRIVMPDGTLLPEPFLDIRDRIVPLSEIYDERGLLGLAFHPNFKDNGRFFVYYHVPLQLDSKVFFDHIEFFDHTDIISEFTISGDPNKADINSERILLKLGHPEPNHDGGHIAFGPDGYLYIPLGDGGSMNDIGFGHFPGIGNAQSLNTMFGKILRIDVDNGDPYGIPPDNPFINKGLPEIYAYGLRNPYHIGFDTGGNNELFAGNAGQNLWESVYIINKGGNYGWDIKEGTHCFNPINSYQQPPQTCSNIGPNGDQLIDPIIEIPNHVQGEGYPVVVIGGYVYRGNSIPNLNGYYIFGGLSRYMEKPDGIIYIANRSNTGLWPYQVLNISTSPNGNVGEYVLSFGQDENNELYVLTKTNLGVTGNTGKVYKIVGA